MASVTSTAIVLYLILSMLYVQVIDAGAIRSQWQRKKRYVELFEDNSTKASESMQRLRNDSVTYCFDTEPCQFGLYKKSQGRMYAFVIIPSWCACMPSQKCAVDRYDQKKKAEIYTCQNSIPNSLQGDS